MAKLKLIEVETIDSTNDYLKANFKTLPHFTVLRSDFQSKGRGQFERIWTAKPKENLLVSLLLKEVNFKQLQVLSSWLVHSLLSLLAAYGIAARFKEPNDIYVQDKKICGILIETQSSMQNLDYVVVGLGLNINQVDFDELAATSMSLEMKKTYKVRSVMRHLLGYLLTSYDIMVKTK